MPLPALLQRYEQLILDLDGCVWVGENPVPGSVEAVARLREAGKRVAFATNNPRRSGEEYVARLWKMGVQASLGDVVTVGGAVQHLLAETWSGRTAFVIGTQALRTHVADAGLRVLNGTDLASRAELVVVGGNDELTFADLRDAVLAVQRGAELLATSRDPTYPMPDGLWPGTGAVVAAVETATGKRARSVGKPEPELFLTAVDRLGEGRTLVVGDRLDSDVQAASAAGLDAVLVLSGATTAELAGAPGGDGKPVAVASSLAALVDGDFSEPVS